MENTFIEVTSKGYNRIYKIICTECYTNSNKIFTGEMIFNNNEKHSKTICFLHKNPLTSGNASLWIEAPPLSRISILWLIRITEK